MLTRSSSTTAGRFIAPHGCEDGRSATHSLAGARRCSSPLRLLLLLLLRLLLLLLLLLICAFTPQNLGDSPAAGTRTHTPRLSARSFCTAIVGHLHRANEKARTACAGS
jgi:hypothetical protein